MLEWLKTKAILILGIALALAISGNVVQALMKGITINRQVTNNQYQNQSQNQSTIVINGQTYNIKNLEWKTVTLPVENVGNYLNGLLLFESERAKVFEKIGFLKSDAMICYPELPKEIR